MYHRGGDNAGIYLPTALDAVWRVRNPHLVTQFLPYLQLRRICTVQLVKLSYPALSPSFSVQFLAPMTFFGEGINIRFKIDASIVRVVGEVGESVSGL